MGLAQSTFDSEAEVFVESLCLAVIHSDQSSNSVAFQLQEWVRKHNSEISSRNHLTRFDRNVHVDVGAVPVFEDHPTD